MLEEETQTLPESFASEKDVPHSDIFLEDWLGEHEHRELQRGDIVRGRIVHVGEDSMMVDVGAKSEGIVPASDLERVSADVVAALREGDSVLVYCITPEDRQGNLLLSISQAQVAQDWEHAETLYDTGELFECEVTGHNKGGVIVHLGKVRGFVPASQLERWRREQYQASESAHPWSELVGERLWLKVIECDVSRNRLILSEQAAMRQRRKSMRDKLLANLQQGDILTGEVTSLADFGAFVNLGGTDGLIHISELSWNRVKHPSEVLSIGDEVRVQILSIDKERNRIGLTMKRLEPEPWQVIDAQYKVGDLVRGTITKLTNFGAFARIDGGIEGLIHISEMTDRMINHPSEVVKNGDEVTLRIIRIEPERRRIGLSLRQVDDEVWLGENGAGEIDAQIDESEDVEEREASTMTVEFEQQEPLQQREQMQPSEVVLEQVATDSDLAE